MKRNFRCLLALILAVIVVISMVSCSNDNKTPDASPSANSNASPAASANGTTADREPYKIDVFTMTGNYSGMQQGWFAKVVKDKFNIELNIISSNIEGADTKFATMMSSGNLGDLIIFQNDNDNKWKDALKANMVLDWTKNGLLDTYGKDIVKNFSKALDKLKITYGNGSAVYGLSAKAANMPVGPSEGKDMTEHSDMRYDLYQKLGSPKINSLDDLLKVLKDMQKLEPKSETGKPTYAFSMWPDWDGNMVMYVKAFAALFGYDEGDGLNDAGFSLFNPEGDVQDTLKPDGWYLKALKMFYKANQMGLVDPDSISQTFNDADTKLKDGQVLFSLFPWMSSSYNTQERQTQGKGLVFVPIKDEKVVSYSFNPRGKESNIIAIGSKAKKPERIMELINWMYTPEGFMTFFNGPKGLTWDLQDGKPVLTADGKKYLPGNPVDVPQEYGGSTYREGVQQINFVPIDPNSVNPETNEPYDYQLWKSTLEDSPTKLIQNWREAMGGALTTKDYLVKNNSYVLKQPVFTGKAPEVLPDNLTQKKGQVATVIKQYSWKMIFAKNDKEFDSLLADMTKKAKGLGYDEVVKWNVDHANQVLDFLKNNKQ
ncbi:MAG: ABC transporter substrate-binding protein [Bacillota bacterium]|nr:ABC transporter substrate-binding protein [Bacillota bacterium]